MPTLEKDFQIELIKEAKRINGRGHRIRHFNMAGLPDLSITVPGYLHTWIECKLEKRTKFSLDYLNEPKPKLSVLQRAFIKKENSAGGRAGWALLLTYKGRTDMDIVVGLDRGPTKTINRQRGERWPLLFIMDSIDSLWSENYG